MRLDKTYSVSQDEMMDMLDGFDSNKQGPS